MDDDWAERQGSIFFLAWCGLSCAIYEGLSCFSYCAHARSSVLTFIWLSPLSDCKLTAAAVVLNIRDLPLIFCFHLYLPRFYWDILLASKTSRVYKLPDPAQFWQARVPGHATYPIILHWGDKTSTLLYLCHTRIYRPPPDPEIRHPCRNCITSRSCSLGPRATYMVIPDLWPIFGWSQF